MPAAEELVNRPTLIVVSGSAGSGKTTLAHRLAAVVGCPALCRDEIKEGMVAATPGFIPATSDPLTVRTYGLFFTTIRLFLEHGVTHVAEAEPGPYDADVSSPTAPHNDDAGHFAIERSFDPIALDAPTLDVDTSDADVLNIEAVAAFVRSPVQFR